MPGQVDAYASWRSAWRALGRPEADRDELETSEGQLRVRVRAYDREKTWAPPYVANELAATRQTAEWHRNAAAPRTAEAATVTGEERARLEREAAESEALARTLDARAAELQVADDARSRWLVHTAATRAEADRSSAELSARRAAVETPEPEVTADEWLAAHQTAMREEDQYREITDEAELMDEYDAPADHRDLVDDVRDIAAAEPPAADEDAVRVPSKDETAEAIRRAQRALAEIQARDVADAQRELDDQAEQITRWHVDDQAVGLESGTTLDDEPTIERGLPG